LITLFISLAKKQPHLGCFDEAFGDIETNSFGIIKKNKKITIGIHLFFSLNTTLCNWIGFKPTPSVLE
jgi:hypothetical protein